MRIRCPTCRREDVVDDDFRWRPFCSRRCKIIDLGNWLEEVYRISEPARDDGEGDEPLPRAVPD
jgi:endogenous inhibitor of DNA gyrase (YacG/DUF329 family)